MRQHGLGLLAVVVVLCAGCQGTPPRPRSPAGEGAAARPAPAVANPFWLAGRDVAGLRVATFAEALALPELELDVGRAALLLAREDRPGLDLPSYLARLDALADQLRRHMQAHPQLARRDSFASFLYLEFRADAADPQGHSWENLYLDRVMDRKTGYCVTLSLLGLAMAERLGLPAEAARIPFHTWLRLDGRNIETTAAGREDADREYARRAAASAASPAYLRPVGKRQVLADLLSNRGALAFRAGDAVAARASLEAALQVDPTLPFAWHNLGVVELDAGRLPEARAAFDRALALDPAAAYTLRRRAEVHHRLGEPASALADLQRALSLPTPEGAD